VAIFILLLPQVKNIHSDYGAGFESIRTTDFTVVLRCLREKFEKRSISPASDSDLYSQTKIKLAGFYVEGLLY
jgi:hypothetical protein